MQGVTGPFLSRGPQPNTDQPRAIITVQIDMTQIPTSQKQTALHFPEFQYNLGDISIAGGMPFYVLDIDMDNIMQGAGIDHIQSLCYYARPWYNINTNTTLPSDFPSGSPQIPLHHGIIVTNRTTLQSVVLGGTMANLTQSNLNAQNPIIEHGALPMHGNVGGLKFRVILPFTDISATFTAMGKYTLNFCNFPVMSYISPGYCSL